MTHPHKSSAVTARPPSPFEQASRTQSFEHMVKTHQGIIRAFLSRLTGNAALGDDLAQDTFLQAHRQFETLQNPAAARAWLFQIAYNTYAAHARKEGRRRQLRAQAPDAPAANITPPCGVAMDIERAMAGLPDDMRAVLMLCLSYGMSHSQVAAAMDMPLGTVKSHVNRGRAQLMRSLSAYKGV